MLFFCRVTDKHQNSKDAEGAARFKRRRVLMEKHASRSENEPLPKQCIIMLWIDIKAQKRMQLMHTGCGEEWL